MADVTGVGVKTIYKYLPVQYGDKNPLEQAHSRGKYYITSLLCASLRSSIFQEYA
nr:MAG TPA: Intercellular adhesion protein R family, intercellular adhesion regulator [Caudoviricetes sp.]